MALTTAILDKSDIEEVRNEIGKLGLKKEKIKSGKHIFTKTTFNYPDDVEELGDKIKKSKQKKKKNLKKGKRVKIKKEKE